MAFLEPKALVKSAQREQGKAAKAAAKGATARADKPGRGRRSAKRGMIRALLGTGMTAAEIAAKVGTTRALVYMVRAEAGMSSTLGRPADSSSKSGRVRALLSAGMSPAEVAKKLGTTTDLVYQVRSRTRSSKRTSGRPRKVGATSGLDGLSGILDAVKCAERDRMRMCAVLEKLRVVIVDALG